MAGKPSPQFTIHFAATPPLVLRFTEYGAPATTLCGALNEAVKLNIIRSSSLSLTAWKVASWQSAACSKRERTKRKKETMKDRNFPMILLHSETYRVMSPAHIYKTFTENLTTIFQHLRRSQFKFPNALFNEMTHLLNSQKYIMYNLGC